MDVVSVGLTLWAKEIHSINAVDSRQGGEIPRQMMRKKTTRVRRFLV
jgi:hypothetical protein